MTISSTTDPVGSLTAHPLTGELCSDLSPERLRILRAAKEKLVEASQRVNHRSTFLVVWDRILTDAERQQLGGKAEPCFKKYKGTIGMWMALHGISRPRAVIQLAFRSQQMSEMDYRWLDQEISKVDPLLPEPKRRAARPCNAEEDLDDKIDRAKSSHKLVVVHGNGVHRLSWDGEIVKQAWGRHLKSWELIWEVIIRRTKGGEVSWDTLTDCGSERTLISRRHHLKNLLPHELNSMIRPGEASGTYRLDLPKKQIAVFELEPGQWLLNEEASQ